MKKRLQTPEDDWRTHNGIARSIDAQDLAQTEPPSAWTQADVSKLLRGHLHIYSIERLMPLLTSLGQDVTIQVRPANA